MLRFCNHRLISDVVCIDSSGISHRVCRGITQIHRSPSRPRPSVRPTAVLINIHEHLIKGLVKASRQQLTNDHEPACMCHCIFFGINPHVYVYLNTMPLIIIARQCIWVVLTEGVITFRRNAIFAKIVISSHK